MATTLTVQRPGLTGAVVTLSAADVTGNNFSNDGSALLIVNNDSGGSINVTVDSKQPCDQGVDHDVVVAVAAGAQKQIGPFPQRRFGGQVDVTYSAVTSVTVGVVSTLAA